MTIQLVVLSHLLLYWKTVSCRLFCPNAR